MDFLPPGERYLSRHQAGHMPDSEWRFPMKALFLAAFVSMGLNMGMSMAADTHSYHAPAHNYYQNNWMGG